MTRNFLPNNILNEQEYKIAELSPCTHQLIADYKVTHLSTAVTASTNHQLLKCLYCTQRAFKLTSAAVTSATASKTDLDKCLLHVAQYKRQLCEVKAQLSLISRDVASLEPEGETWSQLEDKVCKFHFDLSLKHCCSHHGEDKGSSTSLNDIIGGKLPRLKVSSYSGNFVNWQSFWDQYRISVHGRT